MVPSGVEAMGYGIREMSFDSALLLTQDTSDLDVSLCSLILFL